ncbi:membrane protein [Psychroserpens sp. Hel_I_66]|uniref:membrane protein n=1 Tax=Psychroserpens sp. Hel_I_66 TaxID=1250004 RepID=UPI000646C885|nr:membrane protein [Psychroserpens sp. Hel_I_66]
MKETTNKYLIGAILLGLAFHGTSIFFTLESTYDALIHLFFADHYAHSWFEPWNYEWYTGFTVMSYPPLVHQSIAILSMIGGLKFGMFSVALIGIVLFITGVYRFSLLITGNKTAAGYAALLAVFSSSFVETLHIFGQLPSIVGISVLMHALPEIYLWLKTGKYWYLATSLSLIAVTVTSHHVTPIFGMIFFIFPLIGMVIMDAATEKCGSIKAVNFKSFLNSFFKLFKRIVSFGILALTIIVGCILPYWINSKNNPITQVPIPHGSRDNFLEITSSGLVFFLIPWGILLILLPYIFYRYYSKRYLFFGLSITILTILGTGGTTPIPRMVLGETAFNILTLDRFTLWASIMSLPLLGEFAYRFVQGDLKTLIQSRFGAVHHRISGGILAGLFIFMTIFTMSLGYFRPSQPQKIKMLPIVNFLNQDDHDKWRFLTLGFGDQMAWLSAQTNAMTVDGNYHSARRLPELTTRPIERLENSKFKGVAGIGSLQQFLTTPEKYNLKYIFSNDKFYDPILYFCGWQRLQQLENGILVWERLNVPPVSNILPKDDVSKWQKLLWGIIPLLTVLIAFILNIQMLWVHALKTKIKEAPVFLKFKTHYSKFPRTVLRITHIWSILLALIVSYGLYLFYLKNDSQRSPENVILAYYDALDFKEFETAYNLISPNSNKTIAQYMLEVSVTDGLLSSYAKLDAIETEITTLNDSSATAKVITNWITPLEKIKRIDYKTLSKQNGKWYLKPEIIDTDLPPDQLYSNNTTGYFNQGRRRITTEQTHHEDVLKQPVLDVLSAKLVKYDKHYAIVGEIQNIDNVPADVVLKGTLYNEENKELATYNAKYHIKHKLMPKETTAFKINFEGIAWSKTQDSIPKTFNPDEFTPIELEDQPIKFNLQAAGNVSGSDLYKKIVLNDMSITNGEIQGSLFNSGLQEITIPQLLVSYYDANKTLVWVDHIFVKAGIRQQRKQYFKYPLIENGNFTIISDNMENIFVNGLPNEPISNKIVPNRIENHLDLEFQSIEHPNFSFIKIETNTYIGKPK